MLKIQTVSNYLPYQEGPLFPDDSDALANEASTYLRANDRDVADTVAKEDIRDAAGSSFKVWLEGIFEEQGIKKPKQ